MAFFDTLGLSRGGLKSFLRLLVFGLTHSSYSSASTGHDIVELPELGWC